MITKQEFTGYLAASEQTYTFLSQMLFRELNEEAIAALKQLQNRVTDPDSAMYKAIEDLLDKAQSAQSDDQFNSDLDEAQSYLDDKKYDAASGKLDSLANDDSLTDDQKKQVKKLQKQLSQLLNQVCIKL